MSQKKYYSFKNFEIEEGTKFINIRCTKYRRRNNEIQWKVGQPLWRLSVYIPDDQDVLIRAYLFKYTGRFTKEVHYYQYTSIADFLRKEKYQCPNEWLFSDILALREIAKEFHG